MIIRRKHTANFAVMPNAVFNDGRLSLDEKGALGWLLSRPNDWEVSRAACSKFWNVGREKAARIFRSLVETGWAKREEIRGSDGTMMGVRYVITDEPGDPPTLFDPLDFGPDEEAESVASLPQPGKPSTAEPLPEKPSAVLSIKEVLNTELTPPLSPPDNPSGAKPPGQTGSMGTGPPKEEFGPTFTAFFERYYRAKPDPAMSRHAAEKVWVKLSEPLKRQAFEALAGFFADCQRSGRKICDARTFLIERRFENFAGAGPPRKIHLAQPHTPQWHRWREYRIALGQSVQFMEELARGGRGWSTESEWPPPSPAKPQAVSAKSTDPPKSELMTAEDEQFMDERGI